LDKQGYVHGYSGRGDFDGEISSKGRDAIWISENVMPKKPEVLHSEMPELLEVVNVSEGQVVFEGGSFYEPGSGEEFVEGEYALVRPTGEKNLGLNVVEVEEYPLDAEEYLD